MRKKIYLALTLVLIGLLISRGEEAIQYSRDALLLCADMIIPSLFPFFVCSGILIYSGFCQKLSKLFSPVMKPLFNVNPNGSSAFILGVISGYPLGAVTACQLYEANYISKSETERLLSFCNNSGPLFILGSVGIGLYMGLDIGILLYTAHIIGAVLVGICMRFYSKDKHTAPDYELSTPEMSFSEIFRTSAVNAANSMLLICGTILFFSVASRLFLGLVPFEVPPVVYGLFEFSSGNVFIAASGAPIPVRLVMSSIVTGFAGLSVHMQVLAVAAKYHLSMKPYFLGKVMHGLFSGAITVILIKLTSYTPVFAEKSYALSTAFVMASLHAVICITIIVILFLLAYERKAGSAER
ncbi:MAG: sporulation protein [Clostridia bacterium]|nr:sporulation protein [Clostridia bacterium]